MGGTTFSQIEPGADAKLAFQRASEEAGHEHGHGGYTGTLAEKGSFTYITHTPMSVPEAEALADKLINAADPRIDDKWGPAGAIPVILPTRKVSNVGPFEYLHSFADHEANTKALKEAVAPLVKLKAGEEIESIGVQAYTQPKVRGYGTRPIAERRTQCRAVVTIKKPSLTREVPFQVALDLSTLTRDSRGYVDFQERHDALLKAASANVRLKAGEKVVDVRESASVPGKAKVVATATDGKAVTRYIAEGSREHGTWATGFATQAEARKWATERAGRTPDPNGQGVFGGGPQDYEKYEIVGVIKRESGKALVTVERKVAKRTFEVIATVAKEASGEADGWLFFGWASC